MGHVESKRYRARIRLDWAPSEQHNGTLLNRFGGAPEEEPATHYSPSAPEHQQEQEVNLKASQVISRIEAAGWKKIRSEGSHAIFEHPKYGRRSTAFGRPQRDVNKRRLLEVIDDFHLIEIESAKIAARLEESKRRPEPARATLARVVPDPQLVIEMTDLEIHLLWAQLHKEHGLNPVDLRTAVKIDNVKLSDFLFREMPLSPNDREALVAYLAAQEKRLNLTRNRAELLKKGYGARLGIHNAPDPFLVQAREAILDVYSKGILQVDLAQTLGLSPSTLHGIASGRSKTIYADAKKKLQNWMIDLKEPEPLPGLKSEAEYHAEGAQEPQEAPKPVEPTDSIDDELVAIQIVLKAIRPLRRNVALRALEYVVTRIKEGG